MNLKAPDHHSAEPTKLSRRGLLATSAAALLVSGCGFRAPERVNQVIDRAGTLVNTLPENSNMADHAAKQPRIIQQELINGLNRLIQAETNDQTPPRETAVFNQLVQSTHASLRLPNNPNILDAHSGAKSHFESQLEANQFGLFLDGQNKDLYIIQKQGEAVIAIRQMDVTTGAAGFSNARDSGGTPLGAKTVQSLAQGRLNEVVSHNSVPGCTRGQLLNSFQQGQSATACIVTEYIAIDHGRGIGFHGTNYELDRAGNPKINRAASGGCIRCFNADIAAILASGYISEGMPVFIVGPGQTSSNSVATEAIPETVITQPPPVVVEGQPTNTGALAPGGEWVNSGSLD